MDRIRRVLLSQRGEGRGKVVVGIIVVVLIVYGISKFYPPYKTYLEVKKVVEDFMWSNGSLGDTKINSDLPGLVSAVKEDLGREDIVVKKVGNQYLATIDYVETVILIPDKLEHDLEFHVEGFSKPVKK